MELGAVTPVQDQGDCGSCWAFAAMALIESVNFLAGNQLVKLSEQHLIDANNLRNFGCEGGTVEHALEYVIKNGGLLLEEDYPYVGVQGPAKRKTAFGVTIDDQYVMGQVSETALKRMVSRGPVAAVIGADDMFLEHSNTGARVVLDGPNYTLEEMVKKIAHDVVIIGYGETVLGEKFWAIKNSYGGEIMLIARDTGKIGGAFGIARLITIAKKRGPNGLVTDKTDVEMGVLPRLCDDDDVEW